MLDGVSPRGTIHFSFLWLIRLHTHTYPDCTWETHSKITLKQVFGWRSVGRTVLFYPPIPIGSSHGHTTIKWVVQMKVCTLIRTDFMPRCVWIRIFVSVQWVYVFQCIFDCVWKLREFEEAVLSICGQWRDGRSVDWPHRWVHGQWVFWKHDSRDSRHIPQTGQPPQAFWTSPGPYHRKATALEEDIPRYEWCFG